MFSQAPTSTMNPGLRWETPVTASRAASRAKCRFSDRKCSLCFGSTWSTNGSRSLQRIALKLWETPMNARRLLQLVFATQTKKMWRCSGTFQKILNFSENLPKHSHKSSKIFSKIKVQHLVILGILLICLGEEFLKFSRCEVLMVKIGSIPLFISRLSHN